MTTPQAQVAQTVVNPPPIPGEQKEQIKQLLTEKEQNPQYTESMANTQSITPQQPQPQQETQMSTVPATQTTQAPAQQTNNVPAQINPKILEIMQREGGQLQSGVEDVKDALRPPIVAIVQNQTNVELKNKFGISSLYLSPKEILVASAQYDVSNPSSPVILSESVRVGFNPIYSFYSFNVLNPLGVEPWIMQRTVDKKSDIAAKCRAFHSEPVEGSDKNREWRAFINVMGYLVIPDSNPNKEAINEDELVMVSFRGGSFKSGQNFVNLVMSQFAADKIPMCCRYYDLFSRQTFSKGNEHWVHVLENPTCVPVEGVTDANIIERNYELFKQFKETNMAEQIEDHNVESNGQQEAITGNVVQNTPTVQNSNPPI